MISKADFVVVGCATIVIGALIWSEIDQGIDSGIRKKAHVLKCAQAINLNVYLTLSKHHCLVGLEDSPEQASVYLPRSNVGDEVVLTLMQRPISKMRYYVLSNSSQP